MKARILVIDDDTSLRRVLEYNLQEEGYEVQAASGEEGLYMFGQSQPNLVITLIYRMEKYGITAPDKR